MKRFSFIFVFYGVFVFNVNCQDLYSKLFSYEFSACNPAFSSTLDSINFSFYGAIHNSLNDKISDFKYGRIILNTPIGNTSSSLGFHLDNKITSGSTYSNFCLNYSYNLKLQDNISIAAGSSFHIDYYSLGYHQNYDDITYFKLDLGIWIKLYKLQLGIAYEDIEKANTKISKKESYIKNPANDNINFLINYDFTFINLNTLSNSFILYDLKQIGESHRFKLNNILEFRNNFLFGMSTHLLFYNEIYGTFSPIIGYTFKEIFGLMLSVEAFSLNRMTDGPTTEGIFKIKF